ncbi:MAG TPA: nodulation factor ABC transporter ATP-binding protein NodI, partial [Burkholderiaceae bacterium]|nr:nodulation factor ABC transporter ATP-binding protein NodI [Burkholderiaceae bacterium]
RRHVEAEVLELRGDAATARRAIDGLDGRFEAIGDTYYFYARDARAAVQRLDEQARVSFLHRPANLEDVFLKLTGRDLHD